MRLSRCDPFADYRKRLSDACVLIDRDQRRARVTRGLKAAAEAAGGRLATLDRQSALLAEVPDLVEHPTVVTGTFPEEFLALPDEVLATTMVHHQHYFPVVDEHGRPTARFLAVTNTPGDEPARNARIARNAGRVLAARLRAARFFWNADRTQRLDDRLERLGTLVFHKRLGSYREKSERVAALAARIADEVLGQPADVASAARRAGALCKADLATEMVGEFPELQGVMGGVYAREQGEPEAVWKAIYHHYLPAATGGDGAPSRDALGEAAATWAAVALADKADTVVGLFGAGEKPTGSRDPLGIRRQAQGMLRILIELPELTGLEARVRTGAVPALAERAHETLGNEAAARLQAFLLERLRYLLEERGFDRRNVRAVTHGAVGDIRPLDARRKLEALAELSHTTGFRTLATLFKRVRNLAQKLRREPAALGAGKPTPERLRTSLVEPAEHALLNEMQLRGATIGEAVETGSGFREAFAEAAAIDPSVDRFLEEVFVMTDQRELQRARLELMAHVEQVILELADVSVIVSER